MVFVDPEELKWMPYVKTWMAGISKKVSATRYSPVSPSVRAHTSLECPRCNNTRLHCAWWRGFSRNVYRLPTSALVIYDLSLPVCLVTLAPACSGWLLPRLVPLKGKHKPLPWLLQNTARTGWGIKKDDRSLEIMRGVTMKKRTFQSMYQLSYLEILGSYSTSESQREEKTRLPPTQL